MSKWLWAGLLAALLPQGVLAELTAQGAEDRLIVAFKPGLSLQSQRKAAEDKGLKVLDALPEINVLLVQAPSGRATAAEAALAADPKVDRVSPDIWRKWIEAGPASMQETPLPSVESVLTTLPKFEPRRAPRMRAEEEAPWGVKRVNAPAAWPSNQGSGVKVAVIDTGIDPNHPDLKVAGGYNALDKKAPWADDHFHGTHVAGTIAAALDGNRVAGVAPKATLYAVKVLSKEGSGSLFSIMDGIMWTAKNGIQVANMSLGAPQEMPLLQYALQYAKAAGVVLVAAAGNDGKAVNWPAAYPECIAVSALCPAGVTNTKLCSSTAEGISVFSSRGPQIAFIAPGVLIPSTVPLSHDASGVKAYSGTSMASPHVAGLAALAVATGAQGADAVLAKLKSAASKLPGLGDSEQGAGLIDAARIR